MWPVKARRRLATAALVLTAPVLSSCASSFNAQTDQVYNPSAGVDDRSGSVDVLNALVVSGKEGSGTVIATLVDNDQNRDDSLRGIAGTGKDAAVKVTPGGQTTIPAAGLLNLATAGQVFVTGSAIKPGYDVSLTFTFATGAAATLNVPVVSSTASMYSGVQLPPGS